MKSVALSKVAKIIMGQSPPSSTYNTVGEGLPFFQGKADFGDLYPTVRIFCNKPQKVAEAGDILISVRAPVGPTNISSEKSCIGRGLAAIRSSKNLDSRYLLYFLRFYEPELAEVGKGSTFSAISRSDLERIQVPFPPFPEQKHIAAILAKADRLRRLRRTARDLSDTHLQSVFLEMFGDLITNPLGWKVYSLSALSDSIMYGVTASASMKPIGPRFLRITDIQGGMVKWEDVPYCAISDKEMRENALQSGDIVFARTGATTGKSYLIRDCPKDAVFASYLIRVRPGQKVDPFYLSGYFQSRAYWFQISETASGSAQPGVNATKLGRLQVPLPPLPLQQQFAHIVHQFERLRAQQREAQRQAEHLFQALLHRAFRREV
jgi:type I restriction enzyme S subunit